MMSKPQIAQPIFYSLGLIILIGFLLVIGNTILIPIAFSVLISMLLYPSFLWLQKKRVPKVLSIIICLISLLIFISLIGTFFISGFQNFASDFPILMEKGQKLITNLQFEISERFGFDEFAQMEWLQQNAGSIFQKSQGTISSIVSSTSNFLTNLSLIPLYIFFILLYAHRFKQFFFKLFKSEDHDLVDRILTDIRKVAVKYVTGLSKVIVIIAILNLIGLSIIGIEHAFFFAIASAILTLIPFVGVAIGALLPISYTLIMYDNPWIALYVAIVFIIVQFLEGNIISPNIVGGEVSINPLFAIIALLVGSAIWGISGMVLFVPFLAILKAIMDNIPHLSPYGYLLGDSKN